MNVQRSIRREEENEEKRKHWYRVSQKYKKLRKFQAMLFFERKNFVLCEIQCEYNGLYDYFWLSFIVNIIPKNEILILFSF